MTETRRGRSERIERKIESDKVHKIGEEKIVPPNIAQQIAHKAWKCLFSESGQ